MHARQHGQEAYTEMARMLLSPANRFHSGRVKVTVPEYFKGKHQKVSIARRPATQTLLLSGFFAGSMMSCRSGSNAKFFAIWKL